MLEKRFDLIKNNFGLKIALTLAASFFILMLVFCLHRFYTFYASYDQGLFDQLFWNTIHGRIFQGSLSSGQSSAYTQDGQIQTVFYCHLGQHFVIDFLLWMPIYALFPTGATLVVLQVSLITAAGLVLYALCRHYLPLSIAILITTSFYGANAVIGPNLANFYEHCQIPLFVFSLLLALEKRKWWLFWLFLILILGIREEAGIITFGIGLYLFLSRRYPRLGLAVCLISFSYVTIVTNVIMPLFSNDNSRLYLTTRFDQYVPGNNSPSTLQLLWGIITHPKELIQSLLTPFDKRVKYFLGQWLPLAFIPAISPSAWIVAGPPLLVLLMQDGQSALAMSIRYALTVVPGLFYGTILWWSQHQERFQPSFRRWWIRFIILSIFFTITSNPNRAFYFLIPESIHPWVYVPLTRQWEHVGHIRSLMQYIKSDASVSATTYLLPHLATRRGIIRLPAIQLRLDSGEVIDVDFALADLWQLQQYQPAFKGDRQQLQDFIAFIDQLLAQGKYGLVDVQDGVVLLQKKVASQPQAITRWLEWKTQIQKV
ncbi:MAG: DUF2079 domain-containing protein [Brasilonema octagenarum HA4186-MV1]|jgi:uncharacterized membrane protein|uniref:DUF2079 domain-containing protein n=2 Tax=Brasilonema TaxID=383614 RepID=A0A856MLW5_9CYAN|nr:MULTISPECIES: DUF2079 domain-containing protein [Brasilonema]MBW4625737.1 DUF2079 domain-containing protein [Brasilonema octagenarum HA4186-MV1]QDL17711.1 hypothetical protein DP113_28760 [Brasilonema octagenarum UFV-E1]NMF65604.1 hypothetical protein [Brasilonema octagenarum UFV-OR1]QDL11369.1 hypothetical protein DP114_28840 [Brasilonema sennae CENA114]QDL17760.1 hypothetical protein DP113_29035 [Brasilonema octagenarum UFV-E1]